MTLVSEEKLEKTFRDKLVREYLKPLWKFWLSKEDKRKIEVEVARAMVIARTFNEYDPTAIHDIEFIPSLDAEVTDVVESQEDDIPTLYWPE